MTMTMMKRINGAFSCGRSKVKSVGKSRLIGFAALLPVVACGAGDESPVVDETSSALTSIFLNGGRAYGGQNCDNRLYSGSGDWYGGKCKTECATAMTGLASRRPSLHCTASSNHAEWVDRVACDNGAIGVDVSRGRVVNFGTSSQGGPFIAGHVSFDWAPGMARADCGIDEAVTGIATDPHITNEDCGFWCNSFGFFGDCLQGGSYPLMAVRCSRLTAPAPYTPSSDSCTVMDFSFSDARESTATDDWDFDFFKGECGPGRFVGGIARASIGGVPGRAAKILCCSPHFFPPIR